MWGDSTKVRLKCTAYSSVMMTSGWLNIILEWREWWLIRGDLTVALTNDDDDQFFYLLLFWCWRTDAQNQKWSGKFKIYFDDQQHTQRSGNAKKRRQRCFQRKEKRWCVSIQIQFQLMIQNTHINCAKFIKRFCIWQWWWYNYIKNC